jgi:DNA-directed RNA polymerase II subunit RPB1
MGTVDRRIHCGTCKQDVEGCNGHPGHIVLPIPCYSAFFLMHTLKVLRSICFFCSRLLLLTYVLNPETGKRKKSKLATVLQRYEGLHRFQVVTKLARQHGECPHCGAMQPSYNKRVSQKTFTIDMEWSEESQKQWESGENDNATNIKRLAEEKQMAMKPFTSIDAYNILKHMNHDDIGLLGMDADSMHPKNFMITVLQVPPPVIRPSVMASEGSRSRGQNDLTRKLLEIIKQCNIFQNVLKEHPGVFEKAEPLPKDVIYAIMELQYHVATYMNNPIRGLKPAAARSGAPLKGFQQRIKGKNGRIRGNMTGKRVDFSSRTVVSPDPNLDIDQVGVPLRIALILTITEKVAPYNIEKLQQRVIMGAKKIDGAHTVITDKGRMIYLEFVKPDDRQRLRLEYGWTVERYLQDNDYVLFNRQPSLHKKSLMAHRVKVMPFDTFRLNLSVTTVRRI